MNEFDAYVKAATLLYEAANLIDSTHDDALARELRLKADYCKQRANELNQGEVLNRTFHDAVGSS